MPPRLDAQAEVFAGLEHCSLPVLAAGVEPKVISQMLGHATVAFTMDVYTEVAEELAEAAAAAIAAYIPRRGQPQIHN
jgi:integrase